MKKKQLILSSIQTVLLMIVISGIVMSRASASTASHYTGIELVDTTVKVMFSEETAGLSPHEDDEHGSHALDRAVQWDANGDGAFTDDEFMITAVTPVVHYRESGLVKHYAPLNQSLFHDTANPVIAASGWITSSVDYQSIIQTAGHPLILQTRITVDDPLNRGEGDYFLLSMNITSTAVTGLDNVNISLYLAIDIGDFYNDQASITTSASGVTLKASDQQTDRWTGIHVNKTAIAGMVGDWGDGPGENDDVWQAALEGNTTSVASASGDIDGHLMFSYGALDQDESVLLEAVISFAGNESDLLTGMNATTTTTTTTTTTETTETSSSSTVETSSSSSTETTGTETSTSTTGNPTSTSITGFMLGLFTVITVTIRRRWKK